MTTKSKHKGLMFLLVLPFAVLCAPEVLERWDYATSDSIDRSKIDTRRILRRYESTGDVKEIRNWILNGPSEAAGTQMCLTLRSWAIENQTQFVNILESLSPKELDDFIQKFSGSVNQSSPEDFEKTFANNPSLLIKRIVKELTSNKPLPW